MNETTQSSAGDCDTEVYIGTVRSIRCPQNFNDAIPNHVNESWLLEANVVDGANANSVANHAKVSVL